MSRLFWLNDEQWAAVEPFMPKNQPGARLVDDRRVVSGIIHVLKTGCRWIDCPKEYGPHATIYNRYNRWSRKGFGLGRELIKMGRQFRLYLSDRESELGPIRAMSARTRVQKRSNTGC